MTKYLYTALVRDKEIEEDKPEPDPRTVQDAWRAVPIDSAALNDAITLHNLRHTRLVFQAKNSFDAERIIADLLDAIPDNHKRIIHYESIEEVTDD